MRKTGNSGSNQIVALQEALKHGLAGTRQKLIRTSETLDGMRGLVLSFEINQVCLAFFDLLV